MKYILYILLLSILFSCKQPTQKQENKPKYFEGFVAFENSYDAQDTGTESILRKVFGAKETTYLGPGGFFSREYMDAQGIIFHREIYRPDSLRFYEIFDKSDTILSSDVTRPTKAKLTGFIKNSSFKILNHTVQAVQVRSIETEGKTGEHIYLYMTYYNDTLFAIHPLTYKKITADCIEEMFSLSPYLTTGIRLQFGNKATLNAVAARIVRVHVPLWHFDIPKNKTILDL
ncbi:MAG TPA: hypothetical protein VHB48_06695 [Chitinophagaceae bacterium]|nr:hypothetical protein [Chitinophagaceae bacterium]